MSLPETWDEIQEVFVPERKMLFKEFIMIMRITGFLPNHLTHKPDEEIITSLREDYYTLLNIYEEEE